MFYLRPGDQGLQGLSFDFNIYFRIATFSNTLHGLDFDPKCFVNYYCFCQIEN